MAGHAAGTPSISIAPDDIAAARNSVQEGQETVLRQQLLQGEGAREFGRVSNALEVANATGRRLKAEVVSPGSELSKGQNQQQRHDQPSPEGNQVTRLDDKDELIISQPMEEPQADSTILSRVTKSALSGATSLQSVVTGAVQDAAAATRRAGEKLVEAAQRPPSWEEQHDNSLLGAGAPLPAEDKERPNQGVTPAGWQPGGDVVDGGNAGVLPPTPAPDLHDPPFDPLSGRLPGSDPVPGEHAGDVEPMTAIREETQRAAMAAMGQHNMPLI